MRQNVTRSAALPWHPRDREAHLLAGLLRMSRLTLLYGEAGSGKTTLLQSGVLPLLRRRANDRALAQSADGGVVIPFPDRRASRRVSERDTEVAIFVDAGSESPLATLRTQIHGSLALGGVGTAPVSLPLTESLAAWNKLLGVRFLIILDHFEAYLAAPPDREGIREFGDEFVWALNQPSLPANFLISLRDDAEPLLERFRSRIQNFGEGSLRLPSLHSASPPPLVLRQDPDSPRPAINAVLPPANTEWLAERRRDYASILTSSPAGEGAMLPPSDCPAPAAPVETARTSAPEAVLVNAEAPTPASVENPDPARVHDEMQVSIEAITAEIAGFTPLEPRSDVLRTPAPEVLVHPAVIDVGEPESFVIALGGRLRPALKWIAIPVAAMLLVLVMWPPLQRPDKSVMAQFSEPTATPEKLTVAAASVAPTPVPALPRFEIVTDAGNSTDSRIARELARLVAPAAGIDLGALSSTAWAAGLSGRAPAAPQLAIVSYDALQAARKGNVKAGEAANRLRIVMPLYTEEIYVLARADSPLAFIHEIKGGRINIGPSQGSRALTATRLYERMFGTRMPVTEASFLDEKDALPHLVTDKTIDVMVLVAAQPADLLAHMAPAMARSVKLLKFDRNDPASRKTLQSFLPATVRAADYRNWLAHDTPTLAVMSFLVASNTDDPSTAESLGAFALSLCRNLPVLRQAGHPKWREVQPGLQLDAGWPYLAAAESAFRSCLAERPQQTSS